MNSRLEDMKRASQESVEKALDTSKATLVFDSNWKALIGLTKLTSDTQAEILQTVSELLTREDTQYLLKKIEQSSEQALTEQRKALQNLVSQAGKEWLKLHDEFKAMLTAEQNELFNKLCDIQGEQTTISDERSYKQGFRDGAELVLDILNGGD